MKKFILSLLQFTLFAATFYVVFIYVCGWIFPDFLRRNLLTGVSETGQTSRRLAEADTMGMVDILFLGSSRAYRGFDPRIFAQAGFSSFNLGTSNQSPEQSYYLLQKYVPKLKPQIVIFEVNPDIFSSDGAESAVDIITNSRPDIELLKMSWEVKNIKAVNGYIFTCLQNLFQKGRVAPIKHNIENFHYINGGYVTAKDSVYKKEEGNSYYCRISNKQLLAFDKIIQFLHSEKIRTLLVQAPVIEKLYKSCSENERFDQLIKSRGEYYNFNLIYKTLMADKVNAVSGKDDPLELTDTTYFSDGQHLNQKGVNKFNGVILELLSENSIKESNLK